jgi:hypothetical protein
MSGNLCKWLSTSKSDNGTGLMSDFKNCLFFQATSGKVLDRNIDDEDFQRQNYNALSILYLNFSLYHLMDFLLEEATKELLNFLSSSELSANSLSS